MGTKSLPSGIQDKISFKMKHRKSKNYKDMTSLKEKALRWSVIILAGWLAVDKQWGHQY